MTPTDSGLSFCRSSPNFLDGCMGRPSTLTLSRLTYSRNFNAPEQGLPRGEYSGSHRGHHGAVQGGTTHTSYGVSHGGTYPQALQSSSLQPGAPARYDMAPHPSQQPPMGPRPPTEFVPIYSVQSADSGFVHQQKPGQMNLAWPSSHGSAGAWNPWAGLYLHQSTSESHSPYNPGGLRVDYQLNPRPIAAAPPSRGPAGVQSAWVPFSQVCL
jgi:hypothetical protein